MIPENESDIMTTKMSSTDTRAPRPLDVVVFGATGDTGSAAVRLLSHYAESKFRVQRWAPAARNTTKLQSNVLDPLSHNLVRLAPPGGDDGAATTLPSPCWQSPLQADSDDLDSLVRMCEQTKVVVACAGPYSQYGEKVIAACILAGCHYVDVTGEVDWVNAMRKRYNNAAKSAGVSVVSFCGYDSVPSDLSAWLVADALRTSRDGDVVLVEAML